jgi:hypothetical protein
MKTSKLSILRRASRGICLTVVACLSAGFTDFSWADISHRYSFNDGTANDSVGGANGTLVNGALVSGGMLVLANNGVNTSPATGQYVSLPANILNTPDFTLEAWFTFNGGLPWQRILDLGNSVPDPVYGTIGQGFIILTENGAGRPLGQISINSWGNPSDTDYVFGNTAFPAGGEHCLAYIHNLDAGQEQLWLDGVLIGTAPAHVNPATANYSNFWIGRSQFAQDPFYNGSIDELRTYNNAMAGDQILADYRAGPDVLVVPEPQGPALLAVGGLYLLVHRMKGRAGRSKAKGSRFRQASARQGN